MTKNSVRNTGFTPWRSHSLFGFADFAIVEVRMLIALIAAHPSAFNSES
jgi:hypothetical protein